MSKDECTFLESATLLSIENKSPFLDENPNNFGIEIDQHMSDNNQQNTDITTCSTSTLLDFTNITVNIDENFRDLPPGMKYHFYVSYSSDDSSIVNKIIEELEERFFFKCLNFERDFTPGRRIDQLINEEMNQSEAVLIILSHTYTEKLWCLTEAQLAFEMSFKTNNKIKVIPILIHPLTEELPTVLKSIRYIDAEKEEDVAARIHEIYRNPAVMNVHCVERTADESTQNGASIWTLDAKLHSHCGLIYISNFQELTHENKEKLNSFGDNERSRVKSLLKKTAIIAGPMGGDDWKISTVKQKKTPYKTC